MSPRRRGADDPVNTAVAYQRDCDTGVYWMAARRNAVTASGAEQRRWILWPRADLVISRRPPGNVSIATQSEPSPVRTVAIEEHFSVPHLARRIDQATVSRRGYRPRAVVPGAPNPIELLPEIGENRLKSMDETGITVQVLSISGPGPDLVPGPDGVAMAREVNDHLAAAIAKHPDRFAGFAALPLQSPDAAANELA